ncbi:M23 family metallopeptidase [Alkalimarinus coralli]|uniref:M23 family metallopeptidase n=1 Tax=Alkalimarinus coralli TaxID=2935863 RepID=UPI00202B9A9D|nr:M23 family metallopeptidase [Alkalimarinus coralli]
MRVLAIIASLFALQIFCITTSSAQTVYKYQDSKGRWHFTDKKPTSERFERSEYKKNIRKRARPSLVTKREGLQQQLFAFNPYYGPVEFKVVYGESANSFKTLVLPAKSSKLLFTYGSEYQAKPKHRYWWVAGDPEAESESYIYTPPVPKGKGFRITQAFGGRFSHSKEPSYYAVDIAMPVGTIIKAARAGVVMSVKDDYHMGSVSSKYFLDKANFLTVLHDDGTIASYVHILLGGLMVKAGDRVEVGQSLARSGSTGYSSGPHLHFVIRKNIGMKQKSIPFKFRSNDGTPYKPERNMYIWRY